MQTLDFRTKQLFLERENPCNPDKWAVAVDIGYSGVKLMAPNIVACFPSFAIKSKGKRLDIGDQEGNRNILYKDSNGNLWIVGVMAQDSLSSFDPEMQGLSVYDRNRYDSEMFHVLADVAIGVAYRENPLGSPEGRKMVVRTGLPNTYLKNDSPLIREVFAGHHEFSLKIENGPWINYSYDLAMEDVSVMPQPMGTLLSASSTIDGQITEDGIRLFSTPTLIVDAGFGTTDCFTIRGQEIGQMETFDTISMREVLQRTSDDIHEKYGISIPVPAMQYCLETGTVEVPNRKEFKRTYEPFEDILFSNNAAVAEECLQTLAKTYNYFAEYKNIIVTGGCPWYPIFAERLSGYEGLKVVSGAQNDSLSPIFSNVRGYYLAIAVH